MTRPALTFKTGNVLLIMAGIKTQTRRPVTDSRPIQNTTAMHPQAFLDEYPDQRQLFLPNQPGDILAVLEPWQALVQPSTRSGGSRPAYLVYADFPKPKRTRDRYDWITYRADNSVYRIGLRRFVPVVNLKPTDFDAEGFTWITARWMPNWAPRLYLRVDSQRVERLSAMDEADAIAEGIVPNYCQTNYGTRAQYTIPDTLRENLPDTLSGHYPNARAAYQDLYNAINVRRGIPEIMAGPNRDPWVIATRFTLVATDGNPPALPARALDTDVEEG